MVETVSEESKQDDDDQEEEEVSYFAGGGGPDREEMASEYMPEADDWLAKTILDINDPGAIAALRQFDRMFPEVEEMQPMIDEFLDELLRGKTSVGGASREEYHEILMSMYGGKSDNSDSALKNALAADIADDD